MANFTELGQIPGVIMQGSRNLTELASYQTAMLNLSLGTIDPTATVLGADISGTSPGNFRFHWQAGWQAVYNTDEAGNYQWKVSVDPLGSVYANANTGGSFNDIPYLVLYPAGGQLLYPGDPTTGNQGQAAFNWFTGVWYDTNGIAQATVSTSGLSVPTLLATAATITSLTVTNPLISPLKLSSVALTTPANGDVISRNPDVYFTRGDGSSNALVRITPRGGLFKHWIDAASTSTNGTEDSLYSDTVKSKTLSIVGSSLHFSYSAALAVSATSAKTVRLLFGGQAIGTTGALSIPSVASILRIDGYLINVSATVVRYRATYSVTTTAGVSIFSQEFANDITVSSLTANDTVMKLGATVAATGSAGDITAKSAVIEYEAVTA